VCALSAYRRICTVSDAVHGAMFAAHFLRPRLGFTVGESLLEPIMIVFLGVVVGGMIVAMYLPIFDMVNAVK
jgi:hypothetical protein